MSRLVERLVDRLVERPRVLGGVASAIAGVVAALLFAPYVIGARVQQNFVEFAALPGYEVVVDNYARSWFGAQVRWHIRPSMAAVDVPGRVNGAPTIPGAIAFITRIAHGPIFYKQLFERDAYVGYAALRSTPDTNASPQWKRWLGDQSARADVNQGFFSGFTAHIRIPQLEVTAADGVTTQVRGLDIQAQGSGDAGVDVRVRAAHLGIIGVGGALPSMLDGVQLAGAMERAGVSPWLWVGALSMKVDKLTLTLGVTALRFAKAQVRITSRLEDAELLAAVLEVDAPQMLVANEHFGPTRFDLVARGIRGSAVAQWLQLQAQLRALSGDGRGVSERLTLQWYRDFLPALLQQSPEIALTRGETHWSGGTVIVTARAQLDGQHLLMPNEIDRTFWARHTTVEMSARLANEAAVRMARVWPKAWRSLTGYPQGADVSAAAVTTSVAPQSVSALLRNGSLVPTQHGYAANFAMAQGVAALNGVVVTIPGVAAPGIGDTMIAAAGPATAAIARPVEAVGGLGAIAQTRH